jgi:hypothetical protein
MATGKVSTTSLNMRAEPDANANVNAILVKDAAVDIIVTNDDDTWVLVSALVDGNTRLGWVQTQYIAIDGATDPLQGASTDHGATNPKYPGIYFTALVDGGFYSSTPDNLRILRAIRSNNPGALNDSTWQHARPGYVCNTIADRSGNKTAIYSSPEYGVASWHTLLADHYKFQQSGGSFTIDQLAHAYAGQNAAQSAINSYVGGWCRLADTPLSPQSTIHLSNDDEMLNLARAMFKHESFAIVKISNDQILLGIRGQRSNTLPTPPTPPRAP